MHKRKWIVGSVILVVAAVGWYLFRPELLFVNKKTSEAPPGSSGSGSGAVKLDVIATGEFHTVNHESKGTATIYKLEDGRRVLRFTDFETSNGPALHVYLVAASDAKDSQTVRDADTVDLGDLKGNIGDQNYDVPADVDVSKYRAVTIWCKRFSVNFATAPLDPKPGQVASVRED
jgi:hypothetical protein